MSFADLSVHLYKPGAVLPLHAHAESHLVVVLSGAFVDISGGVERRCTQSTVLLRAAGEPHEEHFHASSTYVTLPIPSIATETAAMKDAAMTRILRRIAESVVCERARALVQQRAASSLPLGTIAAELGITAVRLTRSVRRACGRTPAQLRMEARVMRACEELRRSRWTIAEIAARCGFYDQSHMTNVFRRMIGSTPNRIRENASKT
jgi:AraC-like DNA-binding protein